MAHLIQQVDALRRELNKRDVCIAQLVAQNKEMLAAKERLEMEVTAQKQTLHEQRTHIDVLDTALNNAQGNVSKLEEEVSWDVHHQVFFQGGQSLVIKNLHHVTKL